MKKIIFLISILFSQIVCADALIFTGIPSVRISEGGNDRVVEQIKKAKKIEFSCVIKEVDGKYFWETRGNKQLVKIDTEGFVTFIAGDGSGYIRMIKPELKELTSRMSSTEKDYDYVEHLLIGLRNVTYYGQSK
jgi:hypothetical protein